MNYTLETGHFPQPRNNGVTLIELVVVIAIIAIFAAIAIPYFKGSIPDAYAPEAQAVLAAISTAQQRHKLEHGNFTNDLSKLQNLGLDTNITDKWTFAISNNSTTGFTAVATGNGSVVSELSGKTITLNYNLNSTPHESTAYNF